MFLLRSNGVFAVACRFVVKQRLKWDILCPVANDFCEGVAQPGPGRENRQNAQFGKLLVFVGRGTEPNIPV